MHANAAGIPAIAGLLISKSLISNSLCMLKYSNSIYQS
jgi:hypothetical protein